MTWRNALAELATVSALAADGLADRRTIKARIRDYDVPPVKREGRGDYYVAAHVVEAFKLANAGFEPDHPVAGRIGWLWILEAMMVRGEPLTMEEFQSWVDQLNDEEAPRGPARGRGPEPAGTTPGAPSAAADSTGELRKRRRGPARTEPARRGADSARPES